MRTTPRSGASLHPFRGRELRGPSVLVPRGPETQENRTPRTELLAKAEEATALKEVAVEVGPAQPQSTATEDQVGDVEVAVAVRQVGAGTLEDCRLQARHVQLALHLRSLVLDPGVPLQWALVGEGIEHCRADLALLIA